MARRNRRASDHQQQRRRDLRTAQADRRYVGFIAGRDADDDLDSDLDPEFELEVW